MSLADQIIEHGPYDGTVHPRYGAQTYSFTGTDLNELRDELVAARALKELLADGRWQIEAYGNELALTCGRCGWTAWPTEPADLAELVRRAGEHTEVCR